MSKLLMLISYNLFCAMVLFAAYLTGQVTYALSVDSTYISLIISGIVVASFLFSVLKIRNCMKLEKRISNKDYINKEVLGREQVIVSNTFSEINKFVTTLGLAGTIIGFLIALTAINPESVNDVDMMVQMVIGVLGGTKVALITTLIGAFAFLWNSGNAIIVNSFMIKLLDENVVGGRNYAS